MIVAAAGRSAKWVPLLRGTAIRRFLARRFGLPNAWPWPGETPWETRRLLFVDDHRDGEPVAAWEPR